MSAVRSGQPAPGFRSAAPRSRDPPQTRAATPGLCFTQFSWDAIHSHTGPRLSNTDSPAPTAAGAPHSERRGSPGSRAQAQSRATASSSPTPRRSVLLPRVLQALGSPGLPANPSGCLERRALAFRRSAGPAPGVPGRAAEAAGEWSALRAGPGLGGWACGLGDRSCGVAPGPPAGRPGRRLRLRAAPTGPGAARGGRWSPGCAAATCSRAPEGFWSRLCPSPLHDSVPGLTPLTLAGTP